MRLPPLRRRFQFSLGAALIFVAVASALVGWRVKAARDVDRAVARLRQAGFLVSAIDSSKQWTRSQKEPSRSYWKRLLAGEGEREWIVAAHSLHYQGTNQNLPVIDDASISRRTDDLRAIGPIYLLAIGGTSIGNDSLRHIATLENVRRLELGDSRIRDEGLVHLEQMKQLEQLSLSSLTGGVKFVTKGGMKRVQKALPNCKVYGMHLAY